MAVLGEKQFNSDPRNLYRFSTGLGDILWYSAGAPTADSAASFWTYGVFEGAHTSSAYSANTVKQIYSVTGSSGFLMGAISPNQGAVASYVTWTIVVDGVSYSIQQGNHTKPSIDTRFCLGRIFRLSQTYLNQTNTTGANYTWDTNRGSLNYNYGSNTSQKILKEPHGDPIDPAGTVYFSNSLTVSCTPTQANSSTASQNSGVLVRLID